MVGQISIIIIMLWNVKRPANRTLLENVNVKQLQDRDVKLINSLSFR